MCDPALALPRVLLVTKQTQDALSLSTTSRQRIFAHQRGAGRHTMTLAGQINTIRDGVTERSFVDGLVFVGLPIVQTLPLLDRDTLIAAKNARFNQSCKHLLRDLLTIPYLSQAQKAPES